MLQENHDIEFIEYNGNFLISVDKCPLTAHKLKGMIGEDLYYELLENTHFHIKLLPTQKHYELYIGSKDKKEIIQMIELIKSTIVFKKLI